MCKISNQYFQYYISKPKCAHDIIRRHPPCRGEQGGDVVENINKNPVFPTTPPHVVENIDHVVENTFHTDVLDDVLEDVLHDIIGGQNTLDDMVTVVWHLQRMVDVPEDMVDGAPTTWSKHVVENILENIKHVVGNTV